MGDTQESSCLNSNRNLAPVDLSLFTSRMKDRNRLCLQSLAVKVFIGLPSPAVPLSPTRGTRFLWDKLEKQTGKICIKKVCKKLRDKQETNSH